MSITKVLFLDTLYRVEEEKTSFKLTDPNNETVTINKDDCDIKNGYIFNKGLKFKILETQE